MDYDDLQQSLLILTARASAQNSYVAPTDFINMLPRAIEYGEDRIYRENVFLATRTQDSSLAFTAGSRSINLSAASTIIIVPEGLSAITPAATQPAAGTRLPFTWTTLDAIDIFWPQQSDTRDLSTYQGDLWWTLLDDVTVVVAPTPAAAYVAQVTGLFQPARISATNQTTYISLNYPDLLEAACMIFMAAYLRNFGTQADQPKMAISWEEQYKTLKSSAFAEEQRRRGQGAGWGPNLPTPLANPQRSG